MKKLLLPALGLLCGCASVADQRHAAPAHAMGAAVGVPGRCEEAARPGEDRPGCWFNAELRLGRLPAAVYWHIDRYPDTASAEAARTPASAVVSALGQVFLQTVNDRADWRPQGGERLARVGPFPAPQGVDLTARLMEATTAPGAVTRPHRHSGPEGFFVLAGSMCLETAEGATRAEPGDAMWVRGGLPMQLSSTGTEIRRSLVFVLHPSSEPWMTGAADWAPRGLCRP
jgi:quercetin dioxygenase-like cupin family protein